MEMGLTFFLIVAGVVLAGIIIWVMYTYNRFAARQIRIDEVWDEVDEHLRLRHALVPDLLKLASGRMGGSEALFRKIETANGSIDLDKMGDTEIASKENELSELLRELRNDAAKLDELMLDQKFITTLSELVSMEGRAASACSRHNDMVREYNKSIQGFPANIVVKFLHFDPCEMRIFGDAK